MPKPSGTVYLCNNAIINNSYNDTISFKTASEQHNYWLSLVKLTTTDFMYIRRTNAYIKVPYNLNQLEDVNYLFFRAEKTSKLYYCFVTNKEYISDEASYIYFETDVLQTYMFDYKLKESYVLQEHCDRWTADHKPIYSRTDEGLEYGSEYTVESAYRVVPSISNVADITWYLVVAKQRLKTGDTGAVEGVGDIQAGASQVLHCPNPYVFYLVPSRAVEVETDYKGGLLSNINQFQSFLANSDAGNLVQQIIRLPYLPFDCYYEGNKFYFNNTSANAEYNYFTASYKSDTGISYNISFMRVMWYDAFKGGANKSAQRVLASLGLFDGIENALPTAEEWADVKANPYSVKRDKRFESKLLCYPYRFNYLTDWKNGTAIVKNEYIGADKIELRHLQGIGFNGPARYWVHGYKNDVEGRNNSLLQNAQEDAPVITDAYYTYMLQNRNQLQADRTNALVSIAGNTLSGAVSGGIAGASAGGPAGAITGGITAGVGQAFSGAISYGNMIRNQNAVQKDLKNLPDTIISSNDTSFNLQDNNKDVTFYRMKICCEFEELLADTFAITGYTVKRVKTPNLRSRVRYNYIKTVGANVVGSFNQDELAKIKAIFDNGVTFWHYNTTNFKPYDYSLENIETSLL
ncbi:MAG: hypothetical protein J6R88_01480 [Clostridia bacterium]|nr:hypothetical protein [Clostridia bacterium]